MTVAQPGVYIGLGSNLGDRRGMIQRALAELDSAADVVVAAVSSLRETEPWGYRAQPTFLNGAARLETPCEPRDLLERLLSVERALGRTRGGPRFGPRLIDLDLLLYGTQVIREPGLTVPHPRMHERRFVLEPLLELNPDLTLPDGTCVHDLLQALPG